MRGAADGPGVSTRHPPLTIFYANKDFGRCLSLVFERASGVSPSRQADKRVRKGDLLSVVAEVRSPALACAAYLSDRRCSGARFGFAGGSWAPATVKGAIFREHVEA